ncbi:MAG: winged helix-turn-helix domain-containing protein [Gammaproteobacteria bacterium]
MNDEISHDLRIAGWSVHSTANRISKGISTTRLEPKAMQVLMYLAQRPGEAVTRQRLEDEVWKGTVVSYDALTSAIIKLRKAFGDDPRQPRIIETIPKMGYRLIADVAVSSRAEGPFGQIRSTGHALPRKLAAIFYADVAGYSRLTGEDEEETHRILSAYLDVITDSVQRHDGNVLHYAGDAVLADFTTVVDALSCAANIQRRLAKRNADLPGDRKLQFRIGINLGDVIVDRNEIYGDGVNVAARLESLAEPGGICISGTVYDAIGTKLPLDYEFLGEQSVKNIDQPVRAYQAQQRPGAEIRAPTPPAKTRRSTRQLIAACAALLVIGLGVFSWLAPPSEKHSALPTADKPSIAVLPFETMTGDSEQQYFSDGITDDLITDLSKISGLFVIARNSVFAYKAEPIDVRQVAEELGVRYVLEGSVRRDGEKVRINAQLIDATTGGHLWAERYDHDYKDIFALQDEVISKIVSSLEVKLTRSEQAQLTRPPTSNLEAYDYYLRAEQGIYSADSSVAQATRSFYKKAIALDPTFADAHAGYARALVEAWRLDFSHEIAGAVARKRAYDSAARALELNPNNARAYSVLGVLQVVDGQYDAAIESARKAVSLSPNDAQAYVNLALVLAYSGEVAAAVEAMDTALRLNPRPTPGVLLILGFTLFADHRYDEAIEPLKTARDASPESEFGHLYLAAAYAQADRPTQAQAAIDDLVELYPATNLALYRVVYANHRHERDLTHLLDALRKAGLPDLPFGYEGRDEDRLDNGAIRALTLGRTWAGRHAKGVPFVKQVGEDGSFAYRSTSTFFTGTAKVEGDVLCQQYEGQLMGRKNCGHIYRNSNGSREGNDEYVFVNVTGIQYFSVMQ